LTASGTKISDAHESNVTIRAMRGPGEAAGSATVSAKIGFIGNDGVTQAAKGPGGPSAIAAKRNIFRERRTARADTGGGRFSRGHDKSHDVSLSGIEEG
jgi:hypothetical protein